MFEEMRQIYDKDGKAGVEAWYESLSQAEKDFLNADFQEAVGAVIKAFNNFKQAIVEMLPPIIEILRPLLNAYMDANPDEFERLARKERSRKRYERMMRKKARWN